MEVNIISHRRVSADSSCCSLIFALLNICLFGISAPQLECRVAVAPNGSLVVQWRFTDLGGSNLRLRAFYQVGVAGDLRQVLEVQDVRDDGPMAVVLDNVTAGWTYQFTIEARNQVGGTNTSCYSTPSMGELRLISVVETVYLANGYVIFSQCRPVSIWWVYACRCEDQ